MVELIDKMNNIAASLFLKPCNVKELREREFLKTMSEYGVYHLLRDLERRDAIYYTGKGDNEIIHVKKKWAKKNLKEYDLDFRTAREKFIDGLSEFERAFYGL